MSNMDQYLRGRSRGGKRMLSYFNCNQNFVLADEIQGRDIQASFRISISLLIDWVRTDG